MEIFSLVTLVFIATVHFMMTTVLSLYSRYKVQYLSLAWIMGLFCASFCVAIPFYSLLKFENIGLMHPFMLLGLVATSYLQTIYPLGIAMPGYLQWRRMWIYASPALVLIFLYILNILLGTRPMVIHTYAELWEHVLEWDMLFRIAALVLSVYYVVNILRLPKLLVKNIELPRYLLGYATAIGLNTAYYVVVTVMFKPLLFYIYIYLFSVLNMYLFYRTLETMAIHLPKPVIETVEEAPTTEVIEEVEKENFNEANRQRFERVEYFMQHERGWLESTFGRDRLCEMTGINRHLMLQCLRSQGYNNIHDYINSYRINALKQKVKTGEIKTAADAVLVGFGSGKTARNCFERMEGMSLDDYLNREDERKRHGQNG